MASVLVPLAQGCEELEAVTIIDLLRRAGIEVVSAGLDDQIVTASRGVRLLPDTTLSAVMDRDFDMIVLPGGQPGTNNLNADTRIHALLKRQQRQNKFIAAICAAPKVLASAGLLDGKHVTSFPGSLDNAQAVDMHYETSAVIVDGTLITSRGPGTALDFALQLIETLMGKAKRNEVEGPLQRETPCTTIA